MSFFKSSRDYKPTVDYDALDVIEDTFCEDRSPFGCRKELVDVFRMLMEGNGLRNPENAIEAENLYLSLLTLRQGIV